MRYPKFLPVNGTIGFVAPSFGCATEPYYTAFLNAQKKFQKMGYGLDLGPNCYVAEGIGISNTPQACGKELTDYYCSVDNDILISCGGGEMMCETMNFVDFEKIKSAAPNGIWVIRIIRILHFYSARSVIRQQCMDHAQELLAWSRGMRVFLIQWKC